MKPKRNGAKKQKKNKATNKAAQQRYAAARKAGAPVPKKQKPKTSRKPKKTPGGNAAAQKRHAAKRSNKVKKPQSEFTKGYNFGKQNCDNKSDVQLRKDAIAAKQATREARKATEEAKKTLQQTKAVAAKIAKSEEKTAKTVKAATQKIEKSTDKIEKATKNMTTKKTKSGGSKKSKKNKKTMSQKVAEAKRPSKGGKSKAAKQKRKYAKAAKAAAAPATKTAPKKSANRTSKKRKKSMSEKVKGAKRPSKGGKSRAAKQRAKYAKNAQTSFAELGKAGASDPIKKATLLADKETTAEAAVDAAAAVGAATREVAKEHKVTGEMMLRGKAPETTNEKVELIAVETLAHKSKFGAALRKAASRRSLKYGIVFGHLIGLGDSTVTMARLDNASLRVTGVGYKAWVGLGWLAVGALSEVMAERSKTTKSFVRASVVSDMSTQLAETNLVLEGYNLGVTRYARVRQVAAQLLAGTPLASVTGLGERRERRADRVIGRQALADRVITLISNTPVNQISADDSEAIASKFGLSLAEQEEIFDSGPAAPFVPFIAPLIFG